MSHGVAVTANQWPFLNFSNTKKRSRTLSFALRFQSFVIGPAKFPPKISSSFYVVQGGSIMGYAPISILWSAVLEDTTPNVASKQERKAS